MKNRVILLLGAVLLLASCGVAKKQEGTIRLMQYNVGVFHKSGENSAPDVAAIIKEYKADIVSLNELDSCNTRNPEYQLRELAYGLGGWEYRFGRAIPYRGGAYGDGIVTPSAIVYGAAGNLPNFEGSEVRAFVVVETAQYVFISTHLDHEYENARLQQSRIINNYVLGKYGRSTKPVFLAGDLNATRTEACMQEFAQFWDILTPDAPTYPSDGADECIDYIMLLRNPGYVRVTPLKSGVITKSKEASLAKASDHLPVFADVRIK